MSEPCDVCGPGPEKLAFARDPERALPADVLAMTDAQRDLLAVYGQRYVDACHAMQTGVAYEIDLRLNKAHEPKFLRVGINAAMVEHGAAVELLIEKGIITRLEWVERLAVAMEAEAKSYEATLSKHYGSKITLA